jgi:hypothetical protein
LRTLAENRWALCPRLRTSLHSQPAKFSHPGALIAPRIGPGLDQSEWVVAIARNARSPLSECAYDGKLAPSQVGMRRVCAPCRAARSSAQRKINFRQKSKIKKSQNREKAKSQKRKILKIFENRKTARKIKDAGNLSNRLEPARTAIDPITEMAAWDCGLSP